MLHQLFTDATFPRWHQHLVASLPISANGWTTCCGGAVAPPHPYEPFHTLCNISRLFQCRVRARGGVGQEALWPPGGDASPSRLIGELNRKMIPEAWLHLPKWFFASISTAVLRLALHDSPWQVGPREHRLLADKPATASQWPGELHLILTE